ncbi:uncharacterized protein LOC114932414 [Nylanderia fulva]|uniref:uncharacterized protein LOC114932414 n=1 Tax=Nylanderia fulva TaxID=613905 RepID=UPI0010FB873B|nr:uncharacterized protein LOC114932414 [Nylanderia fulva]
MRNREICSVKAQKNIVSARSRGHPTINNIAVNDETLGVIVQPCRIHTDTQKDDQLVTWKQLSRKKNNQQYNDPIVSYNFSQEFQLLDLDRRCEQGNEIEKENRIEKELITKNDFTQINNELRNSKVDKLESDKRIWLNSIQNLNQTYLIKDSEDIYNEPPEILHNKRKSIKHSPRIEFYFKDRENENEINKRKSDRKIIASDREIRVAEQELKMNIKNKENTKAKVMEHRIVKVKTDSKDSWKENNKESEVMERKLEKLNIDTEDKNNQRLNDEEDKIADYDRKELEINIKDERGSQRMDDVAEFDKLSMNREDKEDKQIAMDDGIIESIKYTAIEKNEQNLSDFDEYIQHLQNASKEYKESFKKLKVSSTDNNNDLISDLLQDFFEPFHSKHEEPTLRTDDKNSLTFSNNFINHTQDYFNLKDEILQYESDACCKQENAADFICNKFDTNNIMSLNSCSNRADPENKTLPCQSNAICCNSLDLTENIKATSPSLHPVSSSRANSLEKYSTKNAEETEINEEIRKNDLIIFYNKDAERKKELNTEISLPQSSAILANESDTCTDKHTCTS